MPNLRLVPVHPIIFAIFPYISFCAHNVEEVFPFGNPPIRLLFLLTLASTFLLALVWTLLQRDLRRGCVIASGYILLFFSYGHLLNFFPALLGPLQLLGASAVFFCALPGIAKRIKDPQRTTAVLNLMAFLMILLPAYQIVVFKWKQDASPAPEDPSLFFKKEIRGPKMDIYYIILDGYAEGRILKEVYGYDNTEFLDFLSAHGFVVLDRALTNYAVTHFSLASSLNMMHLIPRANEGTPTAARTRVPVGNLIRQNRVMKLFKELGYKTFNVVSYWNITSFIDIADHNVEEPISPEHLLEYERFAERRADWTLDYFKQNELSRTFLRTTLIGPWWDMHPKIKQEDYLMPFGTIKSIAKIPGPKMVLAHIVAPHPPYVVDAKCKSLPKPKGGFYGTSWHMKKMYIDQLTCVNQEVKELVKFLLASETSSPEPIIIIQADHGPGSLTADIQDTGPVSDAGPQGILERMSILNALHLPGKSSSDIPENLTPVNTFRVILNQYFATELDLLPNIAFFSTYDKSGQFIEVSPLIDEH